jgi:hypothetical protein
MLSWLAGGSMPGARCYGRAISFESALPGRGPNRKALLRNKEEELRDPDFRREYGR